MLFLLACTSPVPDTDVDTEPADTDVATRTVIALSGYRSGDIHLYDRNGAALGVLDGVAGAQTVVLSPDGELVACAEELDELQRFDATTFAPLGVLLDGTAGFDGPTAAIYGPDGRLYVASFADDRVARFEADGTPAGDAVPAGDAGLDGPDIGMAFGPDGALYVPSWYNGAVIAYRDGVGAPIVASTAGWAGPRALVWDGDALFVTMNGNNAVLRVDGEITTFLEPRRPTGMARLGDQLLITSDVGDVVTAWDLATGASAGVLIDDDTVRGATALAVLELPVP